MMWLRSAAFAAWFHGLTALMLLGFLPLRLLSRARARRLALGYARLWARLALGGLRVLCGVSWQARGLAHVPADGPALIASQHQSAFDTLIWAVLRPRFAYVMKQELLRIPLFGAMLELSGMIPIDRAGGASAVRGLLRAADRAVAEGRQIVIFPEGTRVPPGRRAPLLPGVAALAARTGLPVIPVLTNSGQCWPRGLLKESGTVQICVLPPLPAGLGREELLTRLRAAFALGVAACHDVVDNPVGNLPDGLPPSAS